MGHLDRDDGEQCFGNWGERTTSVVPSRRISRTGFSSEGILGAVVVWETILSEGVRTPCNRKTWSQHRRLGVYYLQLPRHKNGNPGCGDLGDLGGLCRRCLIKKERMWGYWHARSAPGSGREL